MKRLAIVTLGLLGLGGCAASGEWVVGGPPGRASQTLLIMGEDVDPDSVARTDRSFNRVLNEFSTALSAHGFSVYDEAAVTLDTHRQGRSRRSDAELIDIAKGVRNPPIDTIVIFTIYEHTTKRPYTDNLNLRVVGRLLSVHDGRRAGNFETAGADNVRPDCQGGCRSEAIGKIARVLAQDVGDILAEKLAAQGPVVRPPGSDGGFVKGYSLIFDDFSAEDWRGIEDYLVIFSGYRSHRPTSTLHRHFEVWYESSISTAKLQRNLTRMLEELDMRARISFSGNEYNVRQIRFAGDRKPRRSREGW